VGCCQFFYSGHGPTVAHNPDPLLECYKLAKFYGVHPGQFLREPVGAVTMHRLMTGVLLKALAEDED